MIINKYGEILFELIVDTVEIRSCYCMIVHDIFTDRSISILVQLGFTDESGNLSTTLAYF